MVPDQPPKNCAGFDVDLVSRNLKSLTEPATPVPQSWMTRHIQLEFRRRIRGFEPDPKRLPRLLERSGQEVCGVSVGGPRVVSERSGSLGVIGRVLLVFRSRGQQNAAQGLVAGAVRAEIYVRVRQTASTALRLSHREDISRVRAESPSVTWKVGHIRKNLQQRIPFILPR